MKKSKKSVRAATPARSPAVRIARTAKGKKPQYFSDPAIDKLLWMTVSLMQELSVTRDRLDTLERLLDRKQILAVKSIEDFRPTGTAARERSDRRTAYVGRVLHALQAELDALGGDRQSTGEDDALAAVTS